LTPGSVAAQALREIIMVVPGEEERWLLNEISSFNVRVKRRALPKEANRLLRDALDVTLSLDLSTHKDSTLAFSAAALYVLFPRLLLRPLPKGYQGRVDAAEFEKRCLMLSSGDVAGLIGTRMMHTLRGLAGPRHPFRPTSLPSPRPPAPLPWRKKAKSAVPAKSPPPTASSPTFWWLPGSWRN